MKLKATFELDFDKDQIARFDQDLEEICLTLNADFLRENISVDIEKEKVFLSLSSSVIKALKRTIQKYTSDGYFLDNQLALNFDTYNIIDEYSEYLKENYKELLTQSKEFSTRIEDKSDTNLSSIDINLENNDNLFSNLFDQFNNVVIGEDHAHISPKQLVIDNVEELAKRGVIVVIENMTQDLQSHINRCIKSKKYTSLLRYATPVINVSNPNDDEKKSINLKYKMIQTLCKNGIPIIAGDVEIPLLYTNLSERQLIGNFCMLKNLEQYLEEFPEYQGRPVLYFTGSKHAESEKFVMGVAEKTGGIACLIQDAEKLLVVSGKNPYHPTVIIQTPFNKDSQIENEPPTQVITPRNSEAEDLIREENSFIDLINSQRIANSSRNYTYNTNFVQ